MTSGQQVRGTAGSRGQSVECKVQSREHASGSGQASARRKHELEDKTGP